MRVRGRQGRDDKCFELCAVVTEGGGVGVEGLFVTV